MSRTRQGLIGGGIASLVILSMIAGSFFEHMRYDPTTYHKPTTPELVCPVYHPINHTRAPFRFDVNHANFHHIRRTNPCLNPRLFVMMIASPPSASDLRQAVRETWSYNISAANGSVLFYIAHPIHQEVPSDELFKEQKKYGDLILARMNISQSNGWKTVETLGMIDWYVKFCAKKVDFMVKTETSVWWNVKKLARRLKSFTNPNTPVLVGRMMSKLSVQRRKFYPWFTHRSEYGYKYFPSYLNGRPGYAISSKAAVIISRLSTLGKPLWIEDVYITGVLRWRASIKMIGLSKFVPCKIVPVKYRNYRQKIGVYGLTADQIYSLWEEKISRDMEKLYKWDDCD